MEEDMKDDLVTARGFAIGIVLSTLLWIALLGGAAWWMFT
jgi:hypothetical protein